MTQIQGADYSTLTGRLLFFMRQVWPFKKGVYSEVTAACVEYIDGSNVGTGSKAS